MYYVYVLRDKDSGEFYYGYTSDLQRRIRQHDKDRAASKLVYYEAFLSEVDARRRETKLKQYGQARTYLKARIAESLKI
ncbi:MAG: GIY-YIG nuclease family protein [Candidatus Velamenicoccus archaeovorus]